jgi:carbon storage regulator CsrA
MLALSRRGGESVILHHPAVGLIRVKVMTRDKYGAVRLCIEAPKSVNIMREELLERTVDRKLTREGE